HLLTFSLQEGDVQGVEEAQARLSFLAENKKLWSQKMFLDIGSNSISLRDVQSQDELEQYSFKDIFRCDAIDTEKHFPSLLLLVCQRPNQKKPDIQVPKSKEMMYDPYDIPSPPLAFAPNPPPVNPPPYPGLKDDLLAEKTHPPPEEEFIDIFQKYVICRCRSNDTVFVHGMQMVKTTGGPTFGATVSSPAMTSSAVSLLQDTLNEEEKGLWTSLGPNWTLHRSVAANTSVGPSAEAERLYMCSYNFIARNNSELSVQQGETLEVKLQADKHGTLHKY
ncbi:hypothetical protein XENOCAPTIV_005305, partial [Xenoophorus captivus]